MRNIIVNGLKQTPIEEQKFEIVERKGIGHPDSICDCVMNDISIELSREYIKRVGVIMHHNADKSLLVAGETETRFGGGIVKKPMLMIFGDRATFKVDDVDIQVESIAIETAKRWLKENLRFMDPDKHVRFQVELKEGSQELTDIFKRGDKILGSNDTSAAVGYAPLSETEKSVLSTEKFLNSKEFKRKVPECGEDIKVMGMRRDRTLNLIIASAFVDRYVKDEKDYFTKKDELLSELQQFEDKNSYFDKINIEINSLDKRGRGVNGVYLTVLGTSADGADSGQVGRGNRVNGVISLNRPVCSEAAAGKNPVSHVGKIYNILTHKIAQDIYDQVSGLSEVYIWLLSKIGQSIDQPAIACAQVIPEGNVNLKDVQRDIRDIVDFQLENIEQFCYDLAYGRIPIC